MARYRGPVSRLCRREGMKLFLKGSKLLHQEVPLRAPRARRPASTACVAARCPTTASSCARSRRSGASTCVNERQFKRYFETAEVAPGRDRREPPAPARDAPRQRRLPHGLRHQPRPGPPARGPRPLRRQRPSAPTSPPTRCARATASRSARAAARRSTSRGLKDALRGAQRPDWLNVDADKLAGTVSALPRRDQMPLELNEQLVVEYYSR